MLAKVFFLVALTACVCAYNPFRFQPMPTHFFNPPLYPATPSHFAHAPLYLPAKYHAPPTFHVPSTVQIHGNAPLPLLYRPTFSNQWEFLSEVPRSDIHQLPCPTEGFYAHPSNCSLFYRCVDYVGTGTYFSRYLFTCPIGHMWIEGADTCVLGSCDGSESSSFVPGATVEVATGSPAPEVSVEAESSSAAPEEVVEPESTSLAPESVPEAPDSGSMAPETVSESPDSGSMAPETVSESPDSSSVAPEIVPEAPTTAAPEIETQPPAETETEAPAPHVESTDPSTNPPDPVPEPEPSTEAPTTEQDECTGQYLQHSQYCNVYYRCDEPGLRYICPAGTVFDQSRQMCRISAYDENLCVGREIMQYLFRTALYNGHYLLPTFLPL